MTADLAADASRRSASYAQAAGELIALAPDAQRRWTDQRKAAFDIQLSSLRAAIDRTAEGRQRDQAWRDLIRFLQGAIVRDDVALASGGP